MADITFEAVYEMAEQLTPEEKTLLVEKLQAELSMSFDHRVTREAILAEFERRKKAGLFNNQETLRGKYANPNVHLTEEELNATIREIRDQWKEDMDALEDDSKQN